MSNDWAVYVGYQMVSDRDVPCAIFLSEIDALEFVACSEYERYYRRLEASFDVVVAWTHITRHETLDLTYDEESPIFSVIEGGKRDPKF